MKLLPQSPNTHLSVFMVYGHFWDPAFVGLLYEGIFIVVLILISGDKS